MHIRTLTQTVYTRFERVGRIFLLRHSDRCFLLLLLFFRILPVMEAHQLDTIKQQQRDFTRVIRLIPTRHIDVAIQLLGFLVTGVDAKCRASRDIDGGSRRDHAVVLIGHSQIDCGIPRTTLNEETAAKRQQEAVAFLERGVGLL